MLFCIRSGLVIYGLKFSLWEKDSLISRFSLFPLSLLSLRLLSDQCTRLLLIMTARVKPSALSLFISAQMQWCLSDLSDHTLSAPFRPSYFPVSGRFACLVLISLISGLTAFFLEKIPMEGAGHECFSRLWHWTFAFFFLWAKVSCETQPKGLPVRFFLWSFISF